MGEARPVKASSIVRFVFFEVAIIQWQMQKSRYRFAVPPLRLGNFLIVLGPPAARAGAEPIVKSEAPPPPDVDGANAIGPLNGDDGCCGCPKPPPDPKPEGNVKFPPDAGEAG